MGRGGGGSLQFLCNGESLCRKAGIVMSKRMMEGAKDDRQKPTYMTEKEILVLEQEGVFDI